MRFRVEAGSAQAAKAREAAVYYVGAFVTVTGMTLWLVDRENFRAPVWTLFAGLPFVLALAWAVFAGVRYVPLLLAFTNTVRAGVFLGDYFLEQRHTLPRWLSMGMSPGIGGLGGGVHLANGLILVVAVLLMLRAGFDLPPGPFFKQRGAE